jgi:O-antigen ligase
VQYILALGVTALFGLFLVYSFAPLLPLPFQRALMILPNIEVSPEAHYSAMGTLDWRYQIWGEAVAEIRRNPDYLILGKGLTYSAREYQALMLFDYAYWWAILTSTYHQGFLSLLIITGIPGLITGTCLIISGICEHGRTLMRFRSPSSPLFEVYRMILIYLALLFVKFFVIHGDINRYLPQLYYMLFVMGMMAKTMEAERDASSSSTASAPLQESEKPLKRMPYPALT